MADKSLSIKVKVDMPTAGEIENQINRSLQGLKDIKTDVKVNMKVGKLGRIKSQLRKALGNERFNVKAGVKVTGMAELNRLATQIEKVRRLAKEPINMKVDTGIKGVDDAVRQAASSGQLMARTRASQHKEMLQQERQFQKEMRSLQTKLNRAEQGILKNPGSAQADIYRKDLQRIRQEQEELNREYRNWGARNGFSDNQIADRIIQARRKASEGQSSKLAKIDVSNQAKASAAAYRELASAIKEADKAQTRMISAGPREYAALQKQTNALQQQIRYQRESGKLSEEQIARSRKLETSLGLRRGVAEARQADAVRAKRRGVSGGAGIMATMNVWDMLQQGMYGAAAAVAQMNEVDKAITKVTKVVPDGQRAVNKWKKNIYRDASEVGKTAPEFASAVEQWATAGYNLKQSNRLAKASVMGSFVGEVPVNDMVKYMSVPMKAFQKEGLKSTDIINAMNKVSNKHAIEMDDLGQAYQKASSTVAATGTSFSQLTGIITAAQEGTRAGGDAIGNRSSFKEIEFMSNGFSEEILDELVRVMKKINIYVFCSQKQLPLLINYFIKERGCNWNLLTWHKTNPVPACKNKYLSDTEYIFFAREKGVPVYGEYKTKKTYYVTPLNTKEKKLYNHPTVKPQLILENLIVNSSEENNIVLDPFVGSGSTGVAALNNNRRFIGFELNDDYIETAKERIENVKEPVVL